MKTAFAGSSPASGANIKNNKKMEKTFTIFYEHTRYGYYTEIIHSENIHDALAEFENNYEHNGVYGIMETK